MEGVRGSNHAEKGEYKFSVLNRGRYLTGGKQKRHGERLEKVKL